MSALDPSAQQSTLTNEQKVTILNLLPAGAKASCNSIENSKGGGGGTEKAVDTTEPVPVEQEALDSSSKEDSSPAAAGRSFLLQSTFLRSRRSLLSTVSSDDL